MNPVVGETNDGWLNDIRGRNVMFADVYEAIESARGGPVREGLLRYIVELKNEAMTPLFLAAVESAEESILNSLFMAETMTGQLGRTQEALPVDEVLNILKKYNAID